MGDPRQERRAQIASGAEDGAQQVRDVSAGHDLSPVRPRESGETIKGGKYLLEEFVIYATAHDVFIDAARPHHDLR